MKNPTKTTRTETIDTSTGKPVENTAIVSTETAAISSVGIKTGSKGVVFDVKVYDNDPDEAAKISEKIYRKLEKNFNE